MKKTYLLVLVLWLFQHGVAEAIVLDRILAVVNGQVISLSDVESELIFFDQVGPPPPGKGFSDLETQSGIQKLIHHKLLLEEAKRFDVENPTEPQVQEKLDGIQKRFTSPETFEKVLRQNGMTVEDLKQKIAEHLIVGRFIDQRIRFFVIVLPEEISRYYTENQANFKDRPLEEAEKEIEQILFEKKEKEKIEEYLSKEKAKASIQINFE